MRYGPMMHALETFVIAMNTVTLVCGGLVTMLAARAYRRTRSPALGALMLGLGFVTVGAFIAGALHQLFGLDFETGVILQSAATAVGFAILAYSLYVNWSRSPRPRSSA